MLKYVKIRLVNPEDFLECRISTTVLNRNPRKLRDIARFVVENSYAWCQQNRAPEKDEKWWADVQDIQEEFCWGRFLEGQPITAKVHEGTLEFGSHKETDGTDYGGGCHRTIALAVAVLKRQIEYEPFDIELLWDC